MGCTPFDPESYDLVMAMVEYSIQSPGSMSTSVDHVWFDNFNEAVEILMPSP